MMSIMDKQLGALRKLNTKDRSFTEDLGGGAELEMVWVPGGSFRMGSIDGQIDERPAHEVTLNGFWIGKYQVTQAQYQAIMGSNPSRYKGSRNPVELVSWDGATEFCRKLSKSTGKKYTLPSEAQWEYACRAGCQGKFCFGDSESDFGNYAWWGGNSDDMTHPVGEKRPNRFGLYDMHGNVCEWCLDWYHDNYEGAPTNGSAWEIPEGQMRVLLRKLRGDGAKTWGLVAICVIRPELAEGCIRKS
jgi:formylglycine-generating enzyme required for sulfatase activity